MSEKDKGWDYLNSDDVNIMSNGDEGDWGYTNSDGSNSFYGGDGSWGYTNPDRSGTYYGADGSWGYKNSDGSGAYYGKNGSWGYKNSDGSGTYYGNNGSWGYKNSDGSGSYYGGTNSSTYDDDGYSSDDSTSVGIGLAVGLAGVALGLGAAAYSKHKEREAEEARKAEEQRLEEERIRKEKKTIKEHEKQLRKIRMRAFLHNKKNLKIDFSTDDLVGEHYEKVLEELKETGFNNYKAIPVKDICDENKYCIGKVAQVVINGQSWVDEGELIPYDAEIFISYHMKKEIVFPYSSHKMLRRNYEELVQELFALGFTEIYTREIDDLTTGWITRDGSVEKVLIGEKDSFSKGTTFEYDAKIVVEFHTFAKKRQK